MGSVLFRAVSAFDYFTIYGVVFFIIVGVALATLILDLVYPHPRPAHPLPQVMMAFHSARTRASSSAGACSGYDPVLAGRQS